MGLQPALAVADFRLQTTDYCREIESYLTLLGNRTLTAKVGLFLERRRSELTVSESLLGRLSAFVPKGPMYVDRRMKSRFVPKWNLLVPEPLLEGAWETVA